MVHLISVQDKLILKYEKKFGRKKEENKTIKLQNPEKQTNGG